MGTFAIYLRVSTGRQTTGLEAQERAVKAYLQSAGINEFVLYRDENQSGSKNSRPQLDAMMSAIRSRGHCGVIVYSFSRFARSTKHLLEALEEFKLLGVSFVSLTEKVDTESPMGRAVFTIISALAQLERELISERVKSGLANARAKGKRLGRPTTANRELVTALISQGLTYREIARLTGASHWLIRDVIRKSKKCSEGRDSDHQTMVG